MVSIWQRVFFLSLLSEAWGYPDRMPCSDELSAGQNIMGSPAATSTDRTVYFKRSGTRLTCDGTYESGETLTAHISNDNGRFLMEVSGGTFTSGSCGNTRKADENGIEVDAPTDGSTLSLKAGWASSQSTVKIAACSLAASSSSGTVSPIALPTTAPSKSPASAGTPVSSSTSSTSTQTASNDERDDDEASTGETIVIISLIVGTAVLIISGGACLERRRRLKVEDIRKPKDRSDVEQSEL